MNATGTGPLVMRTYTAHIEHARLTPEQLIARLRDEPNSFSPQHIEQRFERPSV